MPDSVRVRYAPSPTGEPHVGNIRTALFNWLFARRYGGSFIVRIEDTDRNRLTEGATESILHALRWLGLDWDEGPEVGGPYAPYFQSERLDLYQREVQRLLDAGHAYLCFCSPERLERVRKEQAALRQPPGYDRRCRDLSGDERERLRARLESERKRPVVRFKVPLEGESAVDDLIRGHVAWRNELQDDFVLLKSDGFPTYHLAVVVDDHHMRVTHVMRAEEWLPSTPKHLLLHRALGYEPPLYAHLPMILGKDRAKLSKRHGATSIMEFEQQGFLPEAMVNFLALLGWSLDDRTQVIPREELVRSFSLERIGKAGAIFDHDKLVWMNGVYLRQLPAKEFVEKLRFFLERDLPAEVERPVDVERLVPIAPLIQERLKTLDEAAEMASFFFTGALEYDPALLVQRRMDGASTAAALRRSLEALAELDPFDAASLEGVLRPLAAELGLKAGQLFGALRVAVTGREAAPPLFQTMEVVGRERCLARIERAIGMLDWRAV